MKHAYCIIAHSEPRILKALIELIDDVRNDIYLLVDAKTDISIYSNIKPLFSQLIYVQRIDIRWGDISQVKAELILFEAAYNNGPYKYYHLLSGVDLPLKSQNYIHHFMDENAGKEFVGFAQGKMAEQDIFWKTRYYHFFLPYRRSKKLLFRLLNMISKFCILFQKVLHIERTYSMELKKGANWVSITHDFCGYLLSKRVEILKTFKYVLCADEIFLQSILWNSDFRTRIYAFEDEFDSCMRDIDWERGAPYTWRESDFSYLKSSNKLFARKFSFKDMQIVASLYFFIKKSV